MLLRTEGVILASLLHIITCFRRDVDNLIYTLDSIGQMGSDQNTTVAEQGDLGTAMDIASKTVGSEVVEAWVSAHEKAAAHQTLEIVSSGGAGDEQTKVEELSSDDIGVEDKKASEKVAINNIKMLAHEELTKAAVESWRDSGVVSLLQRAGSAVKDTSRNGPSPRVFVWILAVLFGIPLVLVIALCFLKSGFISRYHRRPGHLPPAPREEHEHDGFGTD